MNLEDSFQRGLWVNKCSRRGYPRPAGGVVVDYGKRKRDHPDTGGSHGVEGHPPDESLRWTKPH